MKSPGSKSSAVSEMIELRIQIPEDMYLSALTSAEEEGITLEDKLREIVLAHVHRLNKRNTRTEKK